ncbi:MAG TPA: GNAT family N-acetyltransferase [Cyclobacteriaceae bacterium]
MDVIIRKGKASDIPAALKLIKELAEYEQSLNEVLNTEEMMLEDFKKKSIYEFYVAESDQTVVGLALYYMRYSTWKGIRLFLEDIIVTQSKRGVGIGTKLFEKVITVANERGCTGMMWQVLDWNKPAIEFYKKYNSRFDAGWTNCHLDF